MEHSEIMCLQIQGNEDAKPLQQDFQDVHIESNVEEIISQTCASQNSWSGIVLSLKVSILDKDKHKKLRGQF